MEKYGFVYIWYDAKHKRYYVGCHWGHINDGYICSSSNMKSAYKRRPQDFKRRILKTNIDDKKNLLNEEYNWLKMIKKEELGKRYYNLHNYHFNHWSSNKDSKLTIGQKISNSPLRNKRISEGNKGKIRSKEVREKNKKANLGKKLSEETKLKISISLRGKRLGIPLTEQHIQKLKIAAKGRIPSENNKKARIDSIKGIPRSIETKNKISKTLSGRKLSEETKKKISEAMKNKKMPKQVF